MEPRSITKRQFQKTRVSFDVEAAPIAIMKCLPALIFILSFSLNIKLSAAEDEGITWIVNYEGAALPGADWIVLGRPNATVKKDVLHLLDDSPDDSGAYRAAWKMPETMGPDTEI